VNSTQNEEWLPNRHPYGGDVKWRAADGKMIIEMPSSVDRLPCQHAWVFKLTGVE